MVGGIEEQDAGLKALVTTVFIADSANQSDFAQS